MRPPARRSWLRPQFDDPVRHRGHQPLVVRHQQNRYTVSLLGGQPPGEPGPTIGVEALLWGPAVATTWRRATSVRDGVVSELAPNLATHGEHDVAAAHGLQREVHHAVAADDDELLGCLCLCVPLTKQQWPVGKCR